MVRFKHEFVGWIGVDCLWQVGDAFFLQIMVFIVGDHYLKIVCLIILGFDFLILVFSMLK